MDPSAREAILSIPEADLAVAKPQELDLYARALEMQTQLLSPLDYAVTVSEAKRYDHTTLLNRWISALLDGRLYFDGPGPAPVPLTDSEEAPQTTAQLVASYSDEGLALDEDKLIILIHPTRGDRPVYNVAISMPPRFGKSYLVSEHLPAWFLTVFPEYSVLLASYEQTFASEWGGKVRDHIVDHPEYGVEVTGGRNASRLVFDLEGHRGFMKCAGAGGPITGKGGHLMICDDPIKNAADAMSDIERESKDNWWKTTFFTRREPWANGTPGRVILMSTRWHEDDLHGRRVPTAPALGDRWAQLNLMAIFEPTDSDPTDPLGRKEGVSLCPQRIPKRDLVELRSEDSMGEMWFQAMYQGHPSLDEGNILKRPFRYYTATNTDNQTTYALHTPDGEDVFVDQRQCYRFATLDLAASDRKHADWTVFMVFDITPTTPRYILVAGLERIRITTENHEERVKDWYKKWNIRTLHIENKTYGTNLIGRLLGSPGMIIQKLSGDAIPLVRVMPVQYELRNGRLWFPESADWRTEFEAEVTKFPNARHDDMVDCLAYGVEVFQNLPAHMVREPEPVTMEERVRAHAKSLAGRRNKKNRRRRYPGIGKW